MRHQLRHHLFINRAARRQGAIGIIGLAGFLHHPIINQGIGRTAIKGQNLILPADVSQIGNTTEIDHSTRITACIIQQRGVKERCQWRALPSGGHIGVAKPCHHRPIGQLRQCLPIADLQGEPFFRPVNYGLPMKTDKIDRPIMAAQKIINRRIMRLRYQIIGGNQRVRPKRHIGQHGGRQISCVVEHVAQGLLGRRVIGIKTVRPRLDVAHTIAMQNSDIDTIQ